MIPEGVVQEDWVKIGTVLTGLVSSSMWLIGDWLAYGQESYKKDGRMEDDVYDKVAADTGYAAASLKDAKWVCLAIPLSRRRDNLSYNHAKEIVGRAAPKDYDKWTIRATEPGVTVKQLRKELREARAVYKSEEHDVGIKTTLFITDQYVRDMMALEPADFRLPLKAAHLKNLMPVLSALRS